MIHDKDYMMRMVRQFSEFLSRMLLGKNEGRPEEEQAVFDTQMKDIFNKNFDELAAMSAQEIRDWIESRDSTQHVAYYELLGHLFYFRFKEDGNPHHAEKARIFYELWQEKGQIFSLPVTARINELK